jgi:uncharacterized membrane protein
MFPPLPAWDGLHPLVTHFPIGLLLTAPALMVASLLAPRRQAWAPAALLIMVLGVAGAFLATSTGEASADTLHLAGRADAVLERHEELAELARNLFAAMAVVYAAIVSAPRLLARWWRPIFSFSLEAVFLLAYIAPCLVLANAAHEGGRLVHEFGVHASLAASAGASVGEPVPDPEGGAED